MRLMRWKRLINGAFWVVMAVVVVPLIVLLVAVVLLIGLGILAGYGVKCAWNSLPRHRRALARAREAFPACCPGRAAVDWHVCRRGRGKCFVRARLAGAVQPQALWLCAVWDDSGQVDDLGVWQFRHGIRVRHVARAYEASRTAGQAWPVGMPQLLETTPAEQLPRAARPGLHPHAGTVMVVNPDGIGFYASAEVANEVIDPNQAGKVRAYDGDGRPLCFDRPQAGVGPIFLAPLPPPPRDKVFLEDLRHFLVSREADAEAQQRLRQASLPDLVEYGLQQLGELDDMVEGEVE